MSQESVRIAQQGLNLLIGVIRAATESSPGAMRSDPAWHVLHAEVAIYDHDVLDASEYRGQAGFVRWLKDWAGAWAAVSVEPAEFVRVDDRVVSVFRMRATGRSSGVMVERQDAVVWTVSDGKVARIDYYNSRAQALAAVGLEE